MSERIAIAYKVLTADQKQDYDRTDPYPGAPVDLADGYIHLSTAEQLPETLARHFADRTGLNLLAVDLDRLGDALRWEVSRGGALFPHIHAPLAHGAVISAEPLRQDEAGVVQLPV